MHRLLVALLLLSPPALAAGALAPGEPLTARLVEQLAREALAAEDVATDATIEITSPDLPMANKAGRPATVTLDGFSFDEPTGRFSGDIVVVLDSGETGRLRLAGRSVDLVDVAVPRQPIERGTIIQGSDLETRRLPAQRLVAGAVTAADGLIGTQARRRLAAGRPVMARDLDRPVLVRKGQTVTMEYEHGGLVLTTVGQALEAGGAGDQLRVANPDTKEIRHAEVIGPRKVRIAAAGSQLP
ncbi:MAG: flagellar basal body P-ring formation chaperone FlgA [Geminicoccaceae bacterium]